MNVLQTFMKELFQSTKKLFVDLIGLSLFENLFSKVRIDESQLVNGVACLADVLICTDVTLSINNITRILLKKYTGK